MNQDLSLELWQELGAEVVLQPRYACLFSGIPHAHFNKVALQPHVEPDRELIHEICKRFKEKNLPFNWMIPQSLESPMLQTALADESLHPATELIRMSIRLYSPHPFLQHPTLHVVRADTEEQLHAALKVYSECYQICPEQAKAHFKFSPKARFQFYLATFADKPVGCGSLLLGKDSATIFNIGTAPCARNQGVASQMVKALLQDALNAGYTTALLNAMPRALNIYAKAGFTEVARYQLYVST